MPADVEIYDLRNGTHRRVSTRESNLTPMAMFFPYLVMSDVLELEQPIQNDYYVANLVTLGIADEQGNLLPGEGVLEPPR